LIKRAGRECKGVEWIGREWKGQAWKFGLIITIMFLLEINEL